MRIESPQRLPGAPLVAMLVAAILAISLLVQPGLLQGVPLPLRLPLILLGIWALGSAFMQGMGLQGRAGWFRRATSPPWSHGALVAFTLVILIRAWMV
jgi:predicted membrane protein